MAASQRSEDRDQRPERTLTPCPSPGGRGENAEEQKDARHDDCRERTQGTQKKSLCALCDLLRQMSAVRGGAQTTRKQVFLLPPCPRSTRILPSSCLRPTVVLLASCLQEQAENRRKRRGKQGGHAMNETRRKNIGPRCRDVHRRRKKESGVRRQKSGDER
jgi:hypothetical protein